MNQSKHVMIMRNPERYVVNQSKTERHRASAVPFLQRLLNKDYKKQKNDLAKSILGIAHVPKIRGPPQKSGVYP